VRQPSGPASGIRLSSTRFILYGRITAKIRAIPYPSAITTLITMSQRKDEIDWELVGAHPTIAETNVFYKGITEYDIHSSKVNVPNGIQNSHYYTIDWTSQKISWFLDGGHARTVYRHNSTSPLTPPGERWFPSTPSQIQISVWDAGGSDWSGGPIPWGTKTRLSAMYEYIDITCYDDKDRPVAYWPARP
jgi:beta-glucanase (GH16 family)